MKGGETLFIMHKVNSKCESFAILLGEALIKTDNY